MTHQPDTADLACDEDARLSDELLEYRLYRTNYLVLPRLSMSALPTWWTAALERLLQAADETGIKNPSYIVLRDEEDYTHKVLSDPEDEYSRVEEYWPIREDEWANYKRGNVAELCPEFDPSKAAAPALAQAVLEKDAERRRAYGEIDMAHGGLTLIADDFAQLEAAWPPSKRGSRANRAYEAIKQRINAIALCVADARTAKDKTNG